MLVPGQRFLLGLLLLVFGISWPAQAQSPFLVSDIVTQPGEVDGFPLSEHGPVWQVVIGDVLYVAAQDPAHGLEVWRSDGTPGGTWRLTDICPGPCHSQPRDLSRFGDLLLFQAWDEARGWEPWVSDGTRAGTRPLGDLTPGPQPSQAAGSDFTWVPSQGRAFFTRASSASDGVLWSTDGTAEGTRPLLPLRGSIVGTLAGGLLLAVTDEAHGTELWRSDGTAAGTQRLTDLCPGPCPGFSSGHQYFAGDRLLFFTANVVWQLWSTDGTAAGTRLLGDISPPLIPHASYSVVWQGNLYLANDEGLWRSNGTVAGTVLLQPFGPDHDPRPPYRSWAPQSFLPLEDELIFVAGDPTHGLAFWSTRGTPETTRRVEDPVAGNAAPALRILPLGHGDDRVWYSVELAEGVSEVWESDGQAAGTRRVAGLCGERADCLAYRTPRALESTAGRAFFLLSEHGAGTELWSFDGSAAGPGRVRDIGLDRGSSRPDYAHERFNRLAIPVDLAASGDGLLFSAQTSDTESSLWRTDGTAAGTTPFAPVPWPTRFRRIGTDLFFAGGSVLYSSDFLILQGKGVWRTDGTPAGTVEIAPDAVSVGEIGGIPGKVLFGADDGSQFDPEAWIGRELWVSNGAPQGTGLLMDINQESFYLPPNGDIPGASHPGPFEALGGTLLFAADDGLNGRELWTSDGTAAGTRMLADLHLPPPGASGHGFASKPDSLVRVGLQVFFAADDGEHGRELWRTDGTTVGTRLVRDLRPGAEGSAPHDLVRFRGALWFLADSGTGDGLYHSSRLGRVRRLRLLSNRGAGRAHSLTVAGDRLFFVVDTPAAGAELWTSDGTRAGTRLVRDIRPGALGSHPQALTAVDGLLVFAADDGMHGQEPWVSDGTAAGTRPLGDLAPGFDASGPSGFTAAGDFVFFGADDGVHGREVWAVRRGDLAP